MLILQKNVNTIEAIACMPSNNDVKKMCLDFDPVQQFDCIKCERDNKNIAPRHRYITLCKEPQQ